MFKEKIIWKNIDHADRKEDYIINQFGEVVSYVYSDDGEFLEGTSIANKTMSDSLKGIDLRIDRKRKRESLNKLLAIYHGAWDMTDEKKKHKMKRWRVSTLESKSLFCVVLDREKPIHYTNIGVFTKAQMIEQIGVRKTTKKLSEKDVKFIRRNYNNLGGGVLAKRFGVTYNTVRRANKGDNHKSVV